MAMNLVMMAANSVPITKRALRYLRQRSRNPEACALDGGGIAALRACSTAKVSGQSADLFFYVEKILWNRKGELPMSASISSLSLASLPAASPAATAGSAAKAPTAASGGADTVQLTEVQQVYQLYNQGERVSQIASSLSLSEAAVNNYLNLNVTG